MARPRFVPFSGVGQRLGGPSDKKKMRPVKACPRVGKKPCDMKAARSASAVLRPTTMGRIIGDQVQEAACESMMQRGLDWMHKPRVTRSTPANPAVTRKSKDSVVTISREAEDMLSAVLGSANIATHHAKRKTLKVDDMKLVNDILGKCGSYAGLLSV